MIIVIMLSMTETIIDDNRKKKVFVVLLRVLLRSMQAADPSLERQLVQAEVVDLVLEKSSDNMKSN
jgi:hypothetical protein